MRIHVPSTTCDVIRGEEKVKSKSQDCCVTFTCKPTNYLKILLSAHAQTLQANILIASGLEGSKVYDL